MPQNIDTHLHHARLLRAVAQRLADKVLPVLESPESVEDMNFARMVLDYLAADLDVAPALLRDLRDPYRQAIVAALDTFADAREAVPHREALQAIARQDGLAAQREVAALRDLSARVIRDLSDSRRSAGSSAANAIRELGRLDSQWLSLYDEALKKGLAGPAGDQAGGAPTVSGDGSLEPESVTAYLRRAFPNSPDIVATAVSVVPGGKSKRTVAITVANTAELPAKLILRQDLVLKYAARSVINEVAPLERLRALGLPVPSPLYCETAVTGIGGPFYLMERLDGAPIGDFYGPSRACPNTVAEIARAFARLHRLDPREVGLEVTDADPRELVRARIEDYWQTWRDNTTRGSALVDYAYAWARQVIDKPYEGRPVIVHGDAGGFNWLVDDDRLSAILDWEFMHVGDPAEDLGVIRPFAEAAMPWEEFMRLYREAGGPAVDEERIALADLLQWLKGTTLVAMSARNYVEGATQDYMKGMNSFAGLRKIEMKIAAALRRQRGA